ncbi:flagellar basal body-associated FliL family protein [Caldichromatium japonicum]|uniref:Flagellar protein FliL n=1 Tax=Caldichromatium japonicum TaxID=2699430 RepID=A0A6G7VGF4_9GAMM|nr:flagellar basal body-associated FliL family protein [Caldichromatium japonicum]QIK38928.1 flagellar basal body-associated FliL family protein [Caldichromatium japonicum]
MAEKKKKPTAKPPTDAGAAKPAGVRIKLIIILLLALLLLGGGGFAAYYFLLRPKPTDTTEETANADGASAPQPQPAPPPAAAASQSAAPPPTLVYHNLGSFTANLISGQARFLRLGLVVSTFNPLVPAALDKHKPRLRNDILSLLASQDFVALNTPEGKETLREALRQTLVRILASAGEPADIRDVLFNDLIMQ